jgi:hypothetical protein
VSELRFAFATCQDWPSGHYTAYRDMLHNDLDVVLHLGDYTYEYAIDSNNRGVVLPADSRTPVRIFTPTGCGTRFSSSTPICSWSSRCSTIGNTAPTTPVEMANH